MTLDIIGDIHGHADELKRLLEKLGYTYNSGSYSHPRSQVLFVGDYIDRGPKIRETLTLVRQMVDNGNAIALMGNHEYNALCFHYRDPEGGHLRPHLIKNIIQHYQTIKQFQNNQKEYENYIEWFKTLPLIYESKLFRAVHACWDHQSINYLRKKLSKTRLTDNLIYQSVKKGTTLSSAVDIVLKGKEVKLPDGQVFKDKEGTERNEIRIKWWVDPTKSNFKEISIVTIDKLPESNIDTSLFPNTDYYHEGDKPVFFGHYWLNGQPKLYRNNICCLDYSVAKEGHLVAYRYNGEDQLENKNLVYV